jgi:hypothetical protein
MNTPDVHFLLLALLAHIITQFKGLFGGGENLSFVKLYWSLMESARLGKGENSFSP